MRIYLRTHWWPDIANLIANEPELSDTVSLKTAMHVFDSDSDIFSHFLELTKKTKGCRLNPVMEFDDEEISEATYFQLECRGKLIPESKKDYEFNLNKLENAEFIYTGNRIKIRLPRQIALSKISIKPNMIACATSWLAEFILSNNIAEIFRKAGLSGFTINPIYNPKDNGNYEEYFQIYSANIMPRTETDITTIVYEDDAGGYSFRELGCLTYDLKGDEVIQDFNRTSENWSNNYCPIWVVTNRVKECYEQNRLKGWHFRPVLMKDSTSYKKYILKWEELYKKIKINPRNKIG